MIRKLQTILVYSDNLFKHYEIPFFETEIGNLARPFIVIRYCLTLGERNKGLW